MMYLFYRGCTSESAVYKLLQGRCQGGVKVLTLCFAVVGLLFFGWKRFYDVRTPV